MKKDLLKKAAAVLLGVCLTFGAVANMTACSLFGIGGNDNGIVKPDPSDPENPAIDPDEPGVDPSDPENPAIDPDEPGVDPSDPENPATDPDEPGVEPSDPENPAIDPDEPGVDPSDPENPAIDPDEPVVDPEPEEPELPTREEIIAAADTIYGYRVNNRGTDYIRDENGEPIVEFKSDELYDTVIDVFKNKPLSSTISVSFYDNYYGKFSEVNDLYRNYNQDDELYIIASLCEYENPKSENNKTLKILEIPIDLSSNSFKDLENQLNSLVPLNIKTTNYDYKVSNLDYETENYFQVGDDTNPKEYLDKCVELAYLNEEKPENALILFQNSNFELASYDIGNHYKIDIKVVTFGDNEITIDNREVRSSSVIGNGWIKNVYNYENDIANGKKYVAIVKNGTETITEIGEIDYNESITDQFLEAKQAN